MSDYTPGPWFSYEGHDGQFHSEPRILAVNPIGGRPPHAVAVVVDCGEQVRNEANARLIAAAPELLEAAQFVLEQMNSIYAILPWPATCREELEAAIAKATGQEVKA